MAGFKPGNVIILRIYSIYGDIFFIPVIFRFTYHTYGIMIMIANNHFAYNERSE